MMWREYHERTKHTLERLRLLRHGLDWENMPNPFRHYEGVALLDLPADPAPREVPALEVLRGASGGAPAADGAAFLSELFFYSASISASKRVSSSGTAYALRVNPSSGNLHPTEFHFATMGLAGWPDGLFHYRPSSHMAELRSGGDHAGALAGAGPAVVVVLTSIAWREAWKYGERAYRYCLHDIGHAWQSLALAARAMGADVRAHGDFADDDVSKLLLLEDEWPMLLVTLSGTALPAGSRPAAETAVAGGQPNTLSARQVPHPGIDEIHRATKVRYRASPAGSAEVHELPGGGIVALPPGVRTGRGFGQVVRGRRSALDFRGGSGSVTLAELGTLLACTAEPFHADFLASRLVSLFLYVHRVRDLAPGVYRYWPEHAALERLKSGDQRLTAAALSLGQDLAGNASVAFSMIGDFEEATRRYGDRGYRYVHFEAGAVGQRLYVAAEALGLGATGIGAFFDDDVHRYLGLGTGGGQVVYHFAVGHAVPDPRLEA